MGGADEVNGGDTIGGERTTRKRLEAAHHFGGGHAEGGRHQADGEEATAAETQCGCGRGKGSGGCEWRVGEGREDCWELQSNQWEAWSETTRTPWPVAGCNRPAGLSEE